MKVDEAEEIIRLYGEHCANLVLLQRDKATIESSIQTTSKRIEDMSRNVADAAQVIRRSKEVSG